MGAEPSQVTGFYVSEKLRQEDIFSNNRQIPEFQNSFELLHSHHKNEGEIDYQFSFCPSGFFVGFIMTLANYCFLACLIAFFVTSSKATKFRAKEKRKFEEEYDTGTISRMNTGLSSFHRLWFGLVEMMVYLKSYNFKNHFLFFLFTGFSEFDLIWFGARKSP